MTVALDGPGPADALSAAFVAAASDGTILIEINVGLGRRGVRSTADAIALARVVDALPGLSVTGISFYPVVVGAWSSSSGCRRVARLRELRDALIRAGIVCTSLSGGSTPTRYLTHTTCVNELRIGTYALLDRKEAASEA